MARYSKSKGSTFVPSIVFTKLTKKYNLRILNCVSARRRHSRDGLLFFSSLTEMNAPQSLGLSLSLSIHCESLNPQCQCRNKGTQHIRIRAHHENGKQHSNGGRRVKRNHFHGIFILINYDKIVSLVPTVLQARILFLCRNIQNIENYESSKMNVSIK